MREREQKVAKIASTFLGFEDHGILTMTVRFDYGKDGSQSMPMMSCGKHGDRPEAWTDEDWVGGLACGMDFVRRMIEVCGVEEWDKVKGCTVLVTCTYDSVLAIEPLPTEEGRPFDFERWKKHKGWNGKDA